MGNWCETFFGTHWIESESNGKPIRLQDSFPPKKSMGIAMGNWWRCPKLRRLGLKNSVEKQKKKGGQKGDIYGPCRPCPGSFFQFSFLFSCCYNDIAPPETDGDGEASPLPLVQIWSACQRFLHLVWKVAWDDWRDGLWCCR